MLFEIITGDYLFDPKKGPHYSKNDDHLARVRYIECVNNNIDLRIIA